MLFTSFRRVLPALTAALVLQAGGAYAQRLITMDNESCSSGLQALSPIINGEIKLSSPPRSFAGKCEASDVILNLKPDIVLRLDKVAWGKGQLESVARGLLPERLKLKITGAHVVSAPKPGSPLSVLAQEGLLERGMNASLTFSYTPKQGKLNLQQAMLRFSDENLIVLSAKLNGVAPALPSNPQIGILPILIEDLTLTVETGRRIRNPAYSLAAFQVHEVNPSMKDAELKATADAYIVKEISAVLDQNALLDLRRFISDAPDPQAPITVRLTSRDGFALIRLIGLQAGSALDKVFEGADLSFRYGR